MRNLGFALALGLLSTGAVAQVESHTLHCEYFDVTTDELIDSACTETWDFTHGGHTIRVGKHLLVFKEDDNRRQGQWSFLTINGRPAVRYEEDRETYHYATNDLKLFLDISSNKKR